ncbi:MAG: DUF4292 domain-containing protein [Bacteroidota bacterium]
MNRWCTIFLVVTGIFVTQCRGPRGISRQKAPVEVLQLEASGRAGIEGFREMCIAADTIRSLIISKAESLIITGDERYEATVTIYAVKDSMIYLSAVNNGFEILRASVDPDSIRVIDRLNKVVYQTPVKKKFGYQQPVNFEDVQNIISRYFICDELYRAMEPDFYRVVFDFDDPLIKKRIFFDRETFKMDKFEFYHTETRKYLTGEKDGSGFRIFTNFMITDFEIVANGGSTTYNGRLPVNMDVNMRKYTFINL